MTCFECRSRFSDPSARDAVLLHAAGCERCEEALYTAYGASIAVPALWIGVEARIGRRRAAWRWAGVPAAAAAAIATIVLLRPRDAPTVVRPQAVQTYRQQIARLVPPARGASAAVADLDTAIARANRAADAAPDDPVAVTRMVAAYDAKLQLLRSGQ